MAGLKATTARLAAYQKQWQKIRAAGAAQPAASTASRLVEVADFGANPGNLRMLSYVPEALPAQAPLVVVLHGCTQNAAGYDIGAGWSTLADRFGFALLLPEQRSANNPNVCFNWFLPGDTARGAGEPASIRQMVERMALDHDIDRSRIFVTGLSAGGAMTSVMLATYPDVFAGGAIIAGLPYGAASNVQEALSAMYTGDSRPASEWGSQVRSASSHQGPWPRVSIWHGSADATVQASNAGEIEKQWCDVHGLSPKPTLQDKVAGYPRRSWRNAGGETLVESYTITGMAHGTPIAAGNGAENFGEAAPFILEAGISSSYRIAQFWGLAGSEAAARPRPSPAASAPAASKPAQPEIIYLPAAGSGPAADAPAAPRKAAPQPETGAKRRLRIDPQKVIDKALRAAGLLGR